jgi:hypothetical protein
MHTVRPTGTGPEEDLPSNGWVWAGKAVPGVRTAPWAYSDASTRAGWTVAAFLAGR